MLCPTSEFVFARIIVTRHAGSPTDFILGSYSTSEQATRYKWIDGKTIYKKTINVAPLPNATMKTINHNISSMDRVISHDATAIVTSSGIYYPLPHVDPGATSGAIRLSIDKTSITITAGSDRSIFDFAYVTIYYTKS